MDLRGALLVDKPSGITSRKVVDEVLKFLPKGIKVGHAGTLDPFSTGLLVVLVGKATRLSSFIMDLEKEYTGTMLLGVETDTGDLEGEIINKVEMEVTLGKLKQAALHFVGTIEQVPPMYSALRYKGKRLYELARKGEEVPRSPRRVKVYSFEILDFIPGENPVVKFKVVVGRGVYLRALVRDFGRYLGGCATLQVLRRVRIGHLNVEDAVPLGELNEKTIENFMLPMEVLVAHLPKVEIGPRALFKIKNGAPLKIWELVSYDKIVPDVPVAAMYESKLVAIGYFKGTYFQPDRVLI